MITWSQYSSALLQSTPRLAKLARTAYALNLGLAIRWTLERYLMIVYALTNEKSFLRPWVKIGKTTRHAEHRRAELSRTSVQYPFVLQMAFETNDDSAETLLHAHFHNERREDNREFFGVGLDAVRTAMMALSNARDVTNDVLVDPSLVAEAIETPRQILGRAPNVLTVPGSPPRKPFRFHLMDLENGYIIRCRVFAATARISGDTTVHFRDETVALRTATLALYYGDRDALNVEPSDSNQALRLWFYEDESLYARYYRTYEASRPQYEAGSAERRA